MHESSSKIAISHYFQKNFTKFSKNVPFQELIFVLQLVIRLWVQTWHFTLFKHNKICFWKYHFVFFPCFFLMTSSRYSIPFPLYTSGGLQALTVAVNWVTWCKSKPVQQIMLGLKQKARTAGGTWSSTSWLNPNFRNKTRPSSSVRALKPTPTIFRKRKNFDSMKLML